ncbi:MAG TPA: histidine phosphatase family protein, partial [Rhodothermales bacterium]|nr:histidine phosphatase family protein [Rhodothermales bacterium]
MKRLLLLRHAKSDWAADYTGDHTRPLAKRGRKSARRMGRFLVTADLRPDLVVSSTATRARDTADMAADAGAWTDVAVHATDALYEASPDALLGVVRALPDAATTVLLVGHEPTFSMTAGRLIGAAAVAVPTGTLAGVDFEVERWADVAFGAGTLCLLVPPRVLDGLGLKKAAELVNASRNNP